MASDDSFISFSQFLGATHENPLSIKTRVFERYQWQASKVKFRIKRFRLSDWSYERISEFDESIPTLAILSDVDPKLQWHRCFIEPLNVNETHFILSSFRWSGDIEKLDK